MGYFGNPNCLAFGGERRISGGEALRPPRPNAGLWRRGGVGSWQQLQAAPSPLNNGKLRQNGSPDVSGHKVLLGFSFLWLKCPEFLVQQFRKLDFFKTSAPSGSDEGVFLMKTTGPTMHSNLLGRGWRRWVGLRLEEGLETSYAVATDQMPGEEGLARTGAECQSSLQVESVECVGEEECGGVLESSLEGKGSLTLVVGRNGGP